MRERLLYGGLGLLFSAVLAYVFYRSILAFFIFSPLCILYPIIKRKELKRKRDVKLNDDFKETILSIASSLSAGYSLENAMTETENEIRQIHGYKSFMVNELERMNRMIGMNTSLETVWEEFASRTDSEDIRNFAEVLRVAKRSGGELTSIISRTADVISDKIRIKNDIQNMTAGKRFEQRIMNVIPLAIVVYIDLTSPGFFNTMYETLSGRIIMTVCLLVYVASVLLSGKILSIEV